MDKDLSGGQSNGDIPQTAVRVYLYQDVNQNQSVDTEDALLGTKISDGDGFYRFDVSFGGSLTVGVGASTNDAEEKVSNGDMKTTDGSLEIGSKGNTPQWVGLRFPNVNLPDGVTIDQASIAFTADGDSDDPCNLTFYGETAVNSATFNTNDYNISSRSRTASSVNWNNVPDWNKEVEYDSPNLAALVSEIASISGWVSGNPMTFLISGNGERKAFSWDDDPDFAPQLSITYSRPAFDYIVVVETLDLGPGHTLTTVGQHTGTISPTATLIDDLDFGYFGFNVGCYAQADNGDNLWGINRFTGYNDVLANVPAGGVEAMTFTFDRLRLLAPDGLSLGEIDRVTGGFTFLPNQVGSGNGAFGNQTFDDIDGLYSDSTTSILFGVQRNDGSPDLLLQIDPVTGSAIPNAFGPGLDYVPITGLGISDDVDDMAINPIDGRMYGINNDNSTYTLITIDKTTGNAVPIGPVGYYDIEGLSFTDDGFLYGTSGSSGNPANSFFSFNILTGQATLIATFNSDSDYEACECRDNPPITGFLPVEWASFEAIARDGENAELIWVTASEVNTANFIVERSTDGHDFEQIDELPAAGNSTTPIRYQYTDHHLEPGTYYYRIRQNDIDAGFSYSEIRYVKFQTADSDANALEAWPNPVSDRLNFSLTAVTKSDLTLISMDGRVLMHREFEAETEMVNYLEMQDYPAGMYFLTLNSNGKSISRKIVKR